MPPHRSRIGPDSDQTFRNKLLRSILFTTALDLLSYECECVASGGGVVVRASCRHVAVEVLEGVPPSPSGRDPPQEEGSMLNLLWRTAFSDDERAIVLALIEGPLAAPAISKRLHESSDQPSTRLKLLLANLCDRGALELGRDGYRLANPMLAEVAQNQTPTPSPHHSE